MPLIMYASPLLRFATLLLLAAVFSACQGTPRTQHTDLMPYAYIPEYSTLVVKNITSNSEITNVRLFNDKRRDSLASATAEKGTFNLVVEHLPLREVYFLEINGRSNRQGTKGLDWTEYVPIYFEEQHEIIVQQHAFNHPGSISNLIFSIIGDSEEQQLLNEWHEALTKNQAEIDGQLSHYILEMTHITKVSGRDNPAAKSEGDITQQHVQQKRPLVTSLFLTYISNDHRAFFSDYMELYVSLPPSLQQTKYGVDLIQRLDRIRAPIQQVDPATQLVAVDPLLKPLNWDDFKNYRYLLLSFWDDGNQVSHETIKQLNAESSQLEQLGAAVIHLSINRKFSQWKAISDQLDLKNSYKLRNQVQQSLIDSLYMTTLPRYVLIQPNGRVVDADVALDRLHDLINPGG